MAASSLKWLGAGSAAVAALVVACSVGHGKGNVDGTLSIEGCRREGPYSLAPDAFFAQTAEQLLSLRLQRGGDIEVYSDGLSVLVRDASMLKRTSLDMDLVFSGEDRPLVSATAYFNDTCPSRRDRVPVLLRAVSGSIRFESIYAPRIDDDDVRISAVLTDVRFEDAENPTGRWAELSGAFDFLYVRGSPAQAFP